MRCQDPRPELEVCLLQIVIQDPQVPALPREGLASRCMLQELGHSPQGMALGGGQGTTCCQGHDVKSVRSHNSGVQEAVVQQVPHHLRAEDTFPEMPRGHPHSYGSIFPARRDHLGQPLT